MAKQHVTDVVAAVIAEEVAAIEAGRDAPIPESAKISRGYGRSKILQVRLNPDELAEPGGKVRLYVEVALGPDAPVAPREDQTS